MASITLSLANYQDGDGNFDAQVMHELTRELDVTFDEISGIDAETGTHLSNLEIEFTGPYMHLVDLIDRYEDDASLRPGLITNIADIHN